MAVEVYYLPPGTRSFRRNLLVRVIEERARPDYSGILVLTPTRLIQEAFLSDFHKLAGDCYIPPRVMTLHQAIRWILAEGSDRLILPSEIVPLALQGAEGWSAGLSVAVSSFIREMKGHFPACPLPSAREQLERTVSELDLAEKVSDRIRDALAAFGRYQDTLASAGALDEDDALLEATRLVPQLPPPPVLILDGFYEMTPAEQVLARALVSRAEHAICVIPISRDNDDLAYCYISDMKHYVRFKPCLIAADARAWEPRLRRASSQEDELGGMARLIKSRFMSGKDRGLDSIHLVLPSLKGYREMMERVFASYGVPTRFASGRTLSRTLPYSDLPALVDTVADGYPRLLFSRVLTSASFRNVPGAVRQIAPRLALDASLVEGRAAWVRAFRRHGVAKEGGWILKILRSLESVRETTPFSEMARTLKDAARRLGFAPPDGASSDLDALLRPLALLDTLGCPAQGLGSLGDALRRILEKSCEETDGGGVVVSELAEVRGLEPRCLYLGGLRDGDIPSKPSMDLLLPESVRRALGLADLTRHMRLQEHIFHRITRSADRLYLSYSAAEGDAVVLPSVFLAGVDPAMDEPAGFFSPEEAHSARPGIPLAKRIVDVGEIPPAGSRALRVTHVDAYRSCPRRFFIEKVLCLEPPEVVDFELEPITIGTVLHQVMEILIPQEIADAAEFGSKAASVLNDVLESKLLDPYFKALIRESFLDMAPRIFKLEQTIREEGYSFHQAEQDVSGEPLPGVLLRGKVDRIDRSRDGRLSIMDYKTGGGELSSTRVRNRGATLQLPLYAALLSGQGERPGRVGLYSLRDLTIKWLPGKRDLKEGLTLEDFTESALGYLRDTADGMARGRYPALPLEDHICRNCHERPYCPYIQKSRLSPEVP